MFRLLLASIEYDPIQKLGPISPHGIGTALGFYLGAILLARRCERRGIPRNEAYNGAVWGAVGAIIGARGFYVLGHADQFDSVVDWFKVWQGGLTMFGGFVGGLLLGVGYLRRKGYSVAHVLDSAAPGFVVGVIVGRIGDLIIADHLGRETDFLFGYRIPPGAELAPGYGPPDYVAGGVYHATALYDLAGALVLLGFLYVIERRARRPGSLFAVFSLWYGLQRFLIDFTRNREAIESSFGGLSGSQWAGLLFAAGGAIALLWLRRRPAQDGAAEREPVGVGGRPNALDPTLDDADAWAPQPARTAPEPWTPPAPAEPPPPPPAPVQPPPPAPPPAPEPAAPTPPAAPATPPPPAPTEPIAPPASEPKPAPAPEPASGWAPPPPPPAPAEPAGTFTEADLLPPQPASPPPASDEDEEERRRREGGQSFGEEPPPGT